jgi:hypothetical protein
MSEDISPSAPVSEPGIVNEPYEKMSTGATLGNIFFDPGSTFEALRHKPRFLVATIITMLIVVGISAVLFTKIDFREFMKQQIDKSPRTAQMSDEQKERIVEMQSGTIGKTIAIGAPIIVIAVFFAAGAGLYLLGVMAMGGAISYKQALSVWAYSSVAPAILSGIVAVIVLLLKSADSIDMAHPESIAQANLAILAGTGTGPTVYALLSQLDLFQFYGLFLAGLGLRKVARISSGSAWTIVLVLFVIKIVCRVGWAAAFGS